MPQPLALLAASATIERLVWATALLLAGVLWVRSRRRFGSPLILDVHTERAAVVVIVAWVLVSRLVGYESPWQPRWYFSEIGPLHIAASLEAPGFAERWVKQLANVQIIFEHQSPLMAPVAAGMQLILGPSMDLPVLIGVVWALIAVVAAWRLGRAAVSPAFGVVFAALVAASPMQLTWSRLGGINIGSPAHVLLVLWCGWVVGSRRGVVAAVGLGILAWCSVYHYFAARIGLLLAPVAVCAGWRSADRSLVRLGTLLVALALGISTCAIAHHLANPEQSLWPEYQGYVGNRNERGALEWLRGVAASMQRETPTAIRRYFWAGRMGPLAPLIATVPSPSIGTLRQPGMVGGGLVLLPVLLLGLLGLARCLRRPLQYGLWLAFAALALLPVLLSVATARRFLVFDVAWCALAALGLMLLLESRLLAGIAARTRWSVGAVVLGAVALWAGAAVGLGSAALPPNRTPIPFAESGFGDGLTCLGCVRTARSWQHELEDGRMVILFDTDVEREDRTSPGGLWMYGKLAALTAGRRDRFLDYYSIVSNFDTEPPRPGFLGPAAPADISGEISARVTAAKPSSIVWWFSQPTAWERTLAVALAAAGGGLSGPQVPPTAQLENPTAMATHPIRVETSLWRWREALDALRALTDAPAAPDCIRLKQISSRSSLSPPLLIAPIAHSGDAPPDWVSTSWGEVDISGVRHAVLQPVGVDQGRGTDGVERVNLVDSLGIQHTYPPSDPARDGKRVAGPRSLGRNCVARMPDGWWTVDPVEGLVRDPAGRPVLRTGLGPAIGLSAYGDRLVVAAADQHLHVVDPGVPSVLRSFPASVAPSRRTRYGECAVIATGSGWIASLDQLRGIVSFYDEGGTLLGRLPLGAARSNLLGLQDMRGYGDFLGVAHDQAVTTFRVVRDPECVEKAREPGRVPATEKK